MENFSSWYFDSGKIFKIILFSRRLQTPYCIVAKNNEAVKHEKPTEPLICMLMQHPGFSAVCLNCWVLQTAWYQYKQQYHNPYEGPEHKQNFHIAYRHLARCCWGILRREVRYRLVVLQSSAVCCIRAHFPLPGFRFALFFYQHKP